MNILSILLSRYHGINVENVFRFQIPSVNGLDAWVPAVSDTSQMLDFDLGVEYEVRPPPLLSFLLYSPPSTIFFNRFNPPAQYQNC